MGKPRIKLRPVRAYAAAKPDRIAGGFTLGPSSARRDVREGLRGLIEHSRHAAQNVDYAKAFERLVRRNVVGERGIQLEPVAVTASGDPDHEAAAAIAKAWAAWGRRGVCTVCGRLGWWNVEVIGALALAREGNFLLRHRTGRGRGPFGYQIELIAIDLLDLTYNAELTGGAWVEAGCEFSAEGVIEAMHFWTRHPGDPRGGARMRRVRVPAAELVHVIRPTDVAQALGVPEGHAAFRGLTMLRQYHEAALTAAHYGAAQMVLFESQGAGPEVVSGEAAAAEREEDFIEAGTAATLPPGMKVANWQPNYPDGEMPAFSGLMSMGSAAGYGVSHASLTGDVSKATYSSLRAGLNEERAEWRIFQRDLYEGLHAEVFKRWLPAAILSGALDLPFSRLIAGHFDAEWVPRGWEPVNPREEAQANEIEFRTGTRSLGDVLGRRGDNVERLAARLARERAALEAAGVPVPGWMRDPAPPPSASAGDDEEAGANVDEPEGEL